MDTPNTELIRGHVDTIILRVLEETDRYGYEILEIISNSSDGRYEIKQPTMYSCLKRLEKQGFISSYFGDESNGGRRRYYKLEEKGREILNQDKREWEFSRSILDKLLSDKQVDLKVVDAPFNASDLRPLTKRVKAYDYDEEDEEEKKAQNSTIAPQNIPQNNQQPFVTITVNQPSVTSNQTVQNQNAIQTPLIKTEVVQPQNVYVPQNNTNSDVPQPKANITAEPQNTINQVAQNNTNNIIEPQNKDIPRAFQPVSEDQNTNPFAFILNDNKPENQNTEQRIKKDPELSQQQIDAQKLLQIGNFSTPVQFDKDYNIIPKKVDSSEFITEKETTKPVDEEKKEPPTEQKHPELSKAFNFASSQNAMKYQEKKSSYQEANYKDTLGNLFNVGIQKTTNDTLSNAEKAGEIANNDGSITLNETRAKQFNDLKQSLAAEGYKLKTYQKAYSKNQYYLNYFYSNRIMRDTSILTYLALVIELLIVFLTREAFEITSKTIIIIGGVGLLFPIITSIICGLNPTKRIKAKFNFFFSIIVSIIAYILIIAGSLIISLINPNIEITDKKVYIPFILASNIIIYVIIYDLLYKSKRYHLK